VLFRYTAVNRQGREETGLAFAPGLEDLRERLRGRGRFLVRGRPLRPARKWSLGERESVFYELGSLISAGVGLADALRLTAREADKTRSELENWSGRVEAGKALSRCVAESAAVADPMAEKMLEVGEATGEMALALRQTASFYADLNGLRRKLISALIYPTIVVAVSVVAMFVLTFYVIPMFLDMFSRYKVALPLVTRALLAFSDFLRDHGVLLAVGLVGLLLLARVTRLTRRPIFFRFLDRLPVLSRVMLLYRNLNLLRIMTNLLRADIRVHDSVDLLRNLFADPSVNGRIDRAADRILEGESLSVAFASADLLSQRDRTLLKIGEETGEIADQVAHLAADYERRLDQTLERFLALFEPLMIVGLSLMIGTILVGLYLPLFNILGDGTMTGR